MKDLGKILFERINELREESGGKFDISNVDAIVEKFIDSMKSHVSTHTDVKIFNEIKHIADQIQVAKQEVAIVRPEKISKDYIPGATKTLNEVTKETEKSTNVILDCAEQIQNIAMSIEDKEKSQVILDKVTEIFEACDFQDLTGQRINKVIKTLEDIESRVGALIKAFTDSDNSSSDSSNSSAGNDFRPAGNNTNKTLVNGPQPQGEAPSQSQIDSLFDSL